VFFFIASLQTAAQDNPVFTGNSRLFNHDGDDNRLFNKNYMARIDMTNQAQLETINDKPRVSTGRLFGEIFGGMLGNVAGGFLGGLIGIEVTKRDDGEWFDGFDGLVLGYFAGSTFGSALGVYAIGNLGKAKGSFGSALLGSFLGEGAAILVLLITRNGEAAFISFVALPPIGAALMFNSSLKHKSLAVSHALLNFNNGEFKVGIPYVRIQPIPGHAKNIKPSVRFDVNLLNIVF
jgi:hypothetical protein